MAGVEPAALGCPYLFISSLWSLAGRAGSSLVMAALALWWEKGARRESRKDRDRAERSRQKLVLQFASLPTCSRALLPKGLLRSGLLGDRPGHGQARLNLEPQL